MKVKQMPTQKMSVSRRANGMTKWAKTYDELVNFEGEFAPVTADSKNILQIKRFDRAVKSFENYSLSRFKGGFFVVSPEGRKYLARLSTFQHKCSCTCPDFIRNNGKLPCKHIYMLFLRMSKISKDKGIPAIPGQNGCNQ